jgi:hypothetical protein
MDLRSRSTAHADAMLISAVLSRGAQEESTLCSSSDQMGAVCGCWRLKTCGQRWMRPGRRRRWSCHARATHGHGWSGGLALLSRGANETAA